MIAPFHRRDTAALAVVAGVLALVSALTAWPAVPGHGWRSVGQGGAAVVVTMIALAALLRRLPPDLRLRPMAEDAAGQAAAPPRHDVARLRIGLLPEALSWYRIDVYLDGSRIGQLRPGTVLVQPMSPGPHNVTLRLLLRRLGVAELINALPGTDSDIVVRGAGGSSRHYSIERRDLGPALANRLVVPVEVTR